MVDPVGQAEQAEKVAQAERTTSKTQRNLMSIRMQMAEVPMAVTVVTPMVATLRHNKHPKEILK